MTKSRKPPICSYHQNILFSYAISKGVDFLEGHLSTLRALARKGLVTRPRTIYGFMNSQFAELTTAGKEYRDEMIAGRVRGFSLSGKMWTGSIEETRLYRSTVAGYGYEGDEDEPVKGIPSIKRTTQAA